MAIRYSGDVELRMEPGGAYYARSAGSDPQKEVVFDPEGNGFYYASIRAPGIRNAAILSHREVGLPAFTPPKAGLSRKPRLWRGRQASSSEAYDRAALAFIQWAEKNLGPLPVERDQRNRIVIRRTFQSPCPLKSR